MSYPMAAFAPRRDARAAIGYDLLRMLREKEATADIPVIALTAYARLEDREAAESAGFDAFIAKPADPAELRSAVAEVLVGERASRPQRSGVSPDR